MLHFFRTRGAGSNDAAAVSRALTWVISILLFAMFLQTGHMVEHVAQIIQKFILHRPTFPGVLGQWLDVEPVHFFFDMTYWFLLFAAFMTVHVIRKSTSKAAYGLLLFAVALQGWHMVEHTVKLGMHFVEGCASCPGIGGKFVDTQLLHYGYNSLVYIAPLIALMLLRPARQPAAEQVAFEAPSQQLETVAAEVEDDVL